MGQHEQKTTKKRRKAKAHQYNTPAYRPPPTIVVLIYGPLTPNGPYGDVGIGAGIDIHKLLRTNGFVRPRPAAPWPCLALN